MVDLGFCEGHSCTYMFIVDRQLAQSHKEVSSYAPFGYNRVMVQDGAKKRPTLEPDPDASRIVKRIFDMAEASNGMVTITSHPQRRGHRQPQGEALGQD